MDPTADNSTTMGTATWRRHAPAIALIVAAFLLLHVPMFHRFGALVNDTGKELGVPLDLLAGKLLYRDTFWPYGPFPPYATAALFGLFGAHFDVILAQARLLSLALCLLVYAGMAGALGRAVAVLGALAVLGFSTTSSFVAVPYSFATLWGTVLLLAGWLLLERAGGDDPRSFRWWLAAGLVTGMAGLCKISMAPVLLAVAGVRLLAMRRGSRRSAVLAFLLPAAFLFATPLVFLAAHAGWDSFALQALAGFHKENIVQGAFYQKLLDALLLRNRVTPADMANSVSTLLVLLIGVWAIAAGAWRCRRGLRRGSAGEGAALALFAAGNLAQLNSTVHAPYLFPGALLAWALAARPAVPATDHSDAAGTPGGRHRRFGRWAGGGCVLVLIAVGLTLGRTRAACAKTVLVHTPTYTFWHRPADGDSLRGILRVIGERTAPGEPVGILEGYDYLSFVAGRPNPFGYYYTWYEPFHRAAAGERLYARFTAARPRLLVLTKEESFSYTYHPNPMGSDLYLRLLVGYRRVDFARTPQFILWWREDAPEDARRELETVPAQVH